MLRTTSAHEEGGERLYSLSTTKFTGTDGRVTGLDLVEVQRTANGFENVPGSERHLPADLVVLAMGFTGPEPGGIVEQLGVELDERGNIARDESYETSLPGVFAAGDAGRGQSLIVWAIAEGRACAAAVDRKLTGSDRLPAPVRPKDRALVV
jgi:glutamate synthase (NADPH/NADH) small chain